MDAIGDKPVGENDSGDTRGSDAGRSNNAFRGIESGTEGSEGRSFLDDVASLGSGVVQDEPEPPYTTAPTTVIRKKRGPKPGSKRGSVPSKDHGISPEACEAFLVGISGGISYFLTGSLALTLESDITAISETANKTEGRLLGESLAKCLDTIPDNPLTRLVNTSSSWLEFVANAAGIVLKRYLLLLQMRMQRQQPRRYEATETASPEEVRKRPEQTGDRFVNPDGTVDMPDPAQANG